MMRSWLFAPLLLLPALVYADPILRTTATTSSTETPMCGPVVGTSQAVCDNTYIYNPAAGGDWQAKSRQIATANAAFGSLHATVEEYPLPLEGVPFESDNGSNITSIALIATAEFTDALTITGDVGQGFVQYLFSGSLFSITSNFTDPDYGSSFWLTHNGTRMLAGTTAPFTPIDGQFTWVGDEFSHSFTYRSPLLPFNWNQPFELNVFGRGQSLLDGDCCWQGEYGHLMVTLDDINVFNAQGQPVNARILSEANAPYAVPEPASILLLGSGLAAAWWRRCR